MSKPIEELTVYDMPDRVQKPDGYEYKTCPEPTAENMRILVEKILELTKAVNELRQKGEEK